MPTPVYMSVLRGRWSSREALSESERHRVRTLIDKLQVLCLKKPMVAAWLLGFMEEFIGRQLNN